MKEFDIKKNVLALPKTSGVYVMHDKDDVIIYVGKAKNLKNRVSSYFNGSAKNSKVLAMTEKVAYFEHFLTPTEADAFILENNLIKKYKPFYNILLKDSKTYPYIKINLKEDYPTFKIVRQVKQDGCKYFGPFTQNYSAKKILDGLMLATKIRKCSSKKMPRSKVKRACIEHDMGNCLAPCFFDVNKKEYLKEVEIGLQALGGNCTKLLDALNAKMQSHAAVENFENALKIRDIMTYVKKIHSNTCDLAKEQDCDVLALASSNGRAVVCQLFIRGGKVLGVEESEMLLGIETEEEALLSFMVDFYSKSIIPNEVIANLSEENIVSLENTLSQLKNKKVKVTSPKSGKKLRLLEMSKSNASEKLKKLLAKAEKSGLTKIIDLKVSLDLDNLPARMECYDISHTQGTLKVGSMVVFENGEKARNLYRKFKINNVEGNNDFACLQEVLARRVSEFEKQEDVSFKKRPDLIIIDGGKGQLSSVLEILENGAFKDVKVISLAEKFEEVFTPQSKKPFMLKRTSEALKVLREIRDEAHRFGITFHRELRTKNMLGKLKNKKPKK